jgi:lipopolysaccharide export system permease protein
MFGTQIHRYLIREILSPTLLCIFIFTMVMVMGQAYKLAGLIIDKGVSPVDIAVLLITLLPTFFSISLPLAFLMGIMIGLGRMSADSETVALKAAGVGLARISMPVLTLALVFSLLTAATTLWVKPWGHRAFATKSFEIARQKATIGLQPRIFMNQFNNLTLYINEVESHANRMQGIFIVDKKPESTSWVFADNGSIITDEAAETMTIRLHDGVIHRQQTDSAKDYQLIHFRNYEIQPESSIMSDPVTKKRKAREERTGELWNDISGEGDLSKQRKMQAELHLRLASPLAPLLFVLFGLPFSMQSHRSGRSGGFVVGLIIFLSYYFLLSAGLTLTKEALTPPWLALWTPQLILAAIGAYFLHQTSREKSNPLVAWIDRTLLVLQKRARKNVDS